MAPASDRGRLGIVYGLSLFLAACSLLYELLIAQSLAFLAGNTVVWYSLTIGTYIGAMGLGALSQGSRGEGSAWLRLHRVELLLSVIGGLSAAAVHLAHSVQLYLALQDREVAAVLLFFGSSLGVATAVGFLTGVELPLLIRLGNELSTGRNVANRVLGFDYIGSLVAGLAFPLLLVPRLELVTIGFAIATLNLAAALTILWIGGPGRLAGARWGRTVVVAGLVLAGLVFAGDVQQYLLKRYYYYYENSESLGDILGPIADRPAVERFRSPYQKVDLVHDDEISVVDHVIGAYSTRGQVPPERAKNRLLFLNGDLQVASNYEEVYHEWFAHVPLILSGSVPRRVLVLGAGDGILMRELLKYEGIEQILHVELDPEFLRLARQHPVLLGLNEAALEDPRVETRLGDAFQFLRKTSEVFDAIYLDFPNVVDYNLAKLYSREFFGFLEKRLAPDGFAITDVVYYAEGDEDWDIYFHTLKAAGFGTIAPFEVYLENDNPEAGRILDERARAQGEEPLSDEERKETLTGLARQQFIAFWKPEGRALHDYWDAGVSLHVLNERRFRHSLRRLPTWSEVQRNRVNSIMRPTLPAISMWHIRRVWGP